MNYDRGPRFAPAEFGDPGRRLPLVERSARRRDRWPDPTCEAPDRLIRDGGLWSSPTVASLSLKRHLPHGGPPLGCPDPAVTCHCDPSSSIWPS